MKRKNKVMAWKAPPFRLDVTQCGIPLTRQVCAGFEQAIDSGYYAPGEKIPPVRAQMDIFGVSLSVAEDALVLLMKTGKVYARPGVGTIVASRNAPVRRGSIVFACPGPVMSYYARSFGNSFAEVVQTAGYACTTVFVPYYKNEKYDFSSLDRALLHAPDLVVLLLPKPGIERHLSEAGARFIVVGQRPCDLPGCQGWIRRIRNAATPAFFRHCREAGVRSIHQLYVNKSGLDVLADVPHPGLKIEAVRLGTMLGVTTLGETRRIGYEGFLEHYGTRRRRLPDLFFTTDDVMAEGVIVALLKMNIRVPEDVRLVSWVHNGDEPVATCELTRIETESVQHGRTVAAAVVGHLEGKPDALDVAIPPVYKVARSFPAPTRKGS